MDYEKKYNEAQKWIESIYSELSHEQQMEAEAFFPELKESENERIRKTLIRFFKDNYPNETEMYDGTVTVGKALAWLEKQGDKKTTDKVEPFDKYKGLTDFERTLADICIGWIGEELGWKQYIKDNADVLLKIAIKKFNSVQDVPFEQNPAWTKEDESNLQGIIYELQANKSEAPEYDIKIYDKFIDWLKSLKGRVQLKQEWGEDDEKRLNSCLNILQPKTLVGNTETINTKWLRTLKQRIGWKPSDEQMRALHDLNLTGNISYAGQGQVLIELYNGLKKLTE